MRLPRNLVALAAGLATLATTGIGTVASATPQPRAPARVTVAPRYDVGGLLLPTTRTSAAARLRSAARLLRAGALPDSVDLRGQGIPAVGDQGRIGSCATWTLAYTMMGYYAARSGAAGAPYAPLYLYMRAIAGSPGPNTGTSFDRDLAEATANGVDTAADYWQGSYNYSVRPTASEIANAAHYKVSGWQALWYGDHQGPAAQTLVEQALAAGNPVALGIPVFASFEAIHDGTLYDPAGGTNLGGHMITAVGYDSQGVWIRNQWGRGWGLAGDAHLSWTFVTSFVRAAYTISGVTATPVPVRPTVSALSARSGQAIGGTDVTVTGANLADATGVSFGGVPATFRAQPWDDGTTRLVAAAPAHAVGTVDVTVTGPGGTSAVGPGDRFSYTPLPPTVSGVSVGQATTAGGTAITVSGSWLTGATSVKVGGAGARFTLLSDTQLQLTAPVHAPGPAAVTVTTRAGTSSPTSAATVTYVAPDAPVITGLSVTSGSTYGGTAVTVTGTGLLQAVGVTVLGHPARFARVSDTSLRVITPAVAPTAAAGDVQVLAPYTRSALVPADQFTYVAPPVPAVTGLSVTQASTTQPTAVTVTGTGFTKATRVTLGGAAVRFTVVSDTQIRAVLPAHAAGTFDALVTTAGGTSSATGAGRVTFVSLSR